MVVQFSAVQAAHESERQSGGTVEKTKERVCVFEGTDNRGE